MVLVYILSILSISFCIRFMISFNSSIIPTKIIILIGIAGFSVINNNISKIVFPFTFIHNLQIIQKTIIAKIIIMTKIFL